ncbi:Uncharacterised protein [Mycobacteroides abscessus subsp. abscessus]|nr:Uncharacterised protein [Mycobacteroides abscessus subsp. abscessus]
MSAWLGSLPLANEATESHTSKIPPRARGGGRNGIHGALAFALPPTNGPVTGVGPGFCSMSRNSAHLCSASEVSAVIGTSAGLSRSIDLRHDSRTFLP